MCGIIGYIGESPAEPILLETIKRLEYRGYDSAGMAVITDDGEPHVRKTLGKIKNLEDLLQADPLPSGRIGIVHTRWATHGNPSVPNAHPHLSSDGRVAVVHNGTLEDFDVLRQELIKDGYTFASQTDTEVLPNLIARQLARGDNSLEDAVAHALALVDGAYGIAVVCRHTREVVAARKSSPLCVGLNGTSIFVASDQVALAGFASHFIPMEDGDIVTISNGKHRFRPSEGDQERPQQVLDVKPEDLGKGIHAHRMIKEILDQPAAIRTTLAGRLKDGVVKLGGLSEDVEQRIASAKRIILVACGTSLYASLAGKLLIESLARIPTEAVHASEFIYGEPILDPSTVVIGVSQSGETADTLQAVKLARHENALTIAINNRVGSALASEVGTGHGIYLHAGAEMAVASTKAFSAQVTVLALLALRLAQLRKLGDQARLSSIIDALERLPSLIEESLRLDEQLKDLAHEYRKAERIFCLGRGFAVPLAYEGALKIKEISYISAEGYPGGELKHGPLALIENGVPVFAIVSADEHGKKMISNIEEVAARGGDVIAITSGNVTIRPGLVKHVVKLPAAPQELLPVVGAPVFQLLSYYIGLEKKNDVDFPRNLAKSVTVE
jgi:glucosamine--fructose-6-phosphate aminotransferase (isomerizing)